jgi:hypothetical protein
LAREDEGADTRVRIQAVGAVTAGRFRGVAAAAAVRRLNLTEGHQIRALATASARR